MDENHRILLPILRLISCKKNTIETYFYETYSDYRNQSTESTESRACHSWDIFGGYHDVLLFIHKIVFVPVYNQSMLITLSHNKLLIVLLAIQ